MTKRDEAFELFSKGRKPNAPCVQALGLKSESVKKYYRLWKRSQGIMPVTKKAKVVSKAPILSSVTPGKKFEYKDKLYRKGSTLNGGNIEAYEMITEKRLVFRPDTFILPK